jgi:hypothetical protein
MDPLQGAERISFEREMLSPFGHLPMIIDRNGPGRKVPQVSPTSDG